MTSVDLPTPDEPSTTAVRPGREVVGGELVHAGARSSAAISRTSTPGRDGLGGDPRALRVGRGVGLVEQHDRCRAAAPRHREVPLEAPEVEVAVEARHDQGHVHVGGEDLFR